MVPPRALVFQPLVKENKELWERDCCPTENYQIIKVLFFGGSKNKDRFLMLLQPLLILSMRKLGLTFCSKIAQIFSYVVFTPWGPSPVLSFLVDCYFYYFTSNSLHFNENDIFHLWYVINSWSILCSCEIYFEVQRSELIAKCCYGNKN